MMEEIRVVIRKGRTSWVAQGLEYDIAAQGKDPKSAAQALVETVVCQVTHDHNRGKQPFEDVPRAPQPFFDLWHEATAGLLGELPRLTDLEYSCAPPAWIINKIRFDSPRIHVE